jgi:hypothetical protein
MLTDEEKDQRIAALEADVARLEAENAVLKEDVAGHVERNARDSGAFLDVRRTLALFARHAQTVVDLHAEHEASGT